MSDRKHNKIIEKSDWTKAKMPLRKDWKCDTWRPTKKTKDILDKLQAAYEINCTDAEAAAHAGISESTINKWKAEDEDFMEQIQRWRRAYRFAIKKASFERAKDVKNRDSTDILFKIDKEYSDKVDANLKAEVSLIWIAKAVQQKRIDRENGKQTAA